MPMKKLPRVAIYTTRNCPNCRQAKAAMKQWGIPFQELNIETSRRAAKEFAHLRGRAVPLIRVGERTLQGYDAKRLKNLLSDAGLQPGGN
ncbi:MAG: glutaredoxin family protein [Pseudomonadota bacterium]